MTLLQALILGLIQGVGELFPVSSLAQTILIPAVLRWPIDEEGADFLAFVVALHLATAIALVIYFWKDWLKIISSVFAAPRRGKLIHDDASKFFWLLVAGTIIVGAFGLVFEKKLRLFFNDRRYYPIVADILIFNGVCMLIGEFIKRRAMRADKTGKERKRTEDLSLAQGAAIGASQTLALFPGISRSGITIVAGLIAGLGYEEACRFSFMLATPVIGLAALLKLPALLKNHHELSLAIPAAAVAGITAYLAVAFLMRYLRNHRLTPFALYCILSGALAWVILQIQQY